MVASEGDGAGEGEADRRDAHRREALRLNDRYLREAVLGFGLCPWAERVLAGDELRREVVLDEALSLPPALAFIDELARAGPAVAVGILIFPCVAAASPAFDRFTEEVRRADRERCRAQGRKDFVMAAFHPHAAETFASPHQLVSFVRRAPDPMIQLVRAELLDQLRATRPSLSDDIAHQNFATVNAHGAGELDAILRALRHDRDETYARLAVRSPSS